MKAIKAFLDLVKVAHPQSHKNLALFPLLAPETGEPDFLTLEEALNQALVEITEVSEGGHVPELRLINRAKDKVLVVDGEELMGAKQNRIVNATFLIAALSEVIIPVSCVEQGRWHYRSRAFESGRKVMPPGLRRDHQQRVSFSLRSQARYESDQGMIWDNLASKAAHMGVHSSTSAMADLFEAPKDHLAEYLRAFRLVECQVGGIFAINSQIVGLEVFGFQKTFGEFFQKLVQSYALDALEMLPEEQVSSIKPDRARRFLETIEKTEGRAYPSLGMGENWRFESRTVSGAALVEGSRMLHCSAFRREEKGNGKKVVPLQRFSGRRQRRVD